MLKIIKSIYCVHLPNLMYTPNITSKLLQSTRVILHSFYFKVIITFFIIFCNLLYIMCYYRYCFKRLIGRVKVLKKVLALIVALSAFVFLLPSNLVSAAEEQSEVPTLPDNEVAFNLNSNTPQEEDVYDDEGKYVGTMGIVPVSTSTSSNASGGFHTMGTYPVKEGSSTFKIYWKTGVINLSYRINISRPKGLFTKAKITKAYDKWHLVTPPFTVNSDTLSILRAQETSDKPAQARYRVRYGIVGQGSINYDLKSKVSKQYLYTSVSSF